MRDPLIGAFVTAGADLASSFGVDELLQRPLGKFSHQIGAVADAERVK